MTQISDSFSTWSPKPNEGKICLQSSLGEVIIIRVELSVMLWTLSSCKPAPSGVITAKSSFVRVLLLLICSLASCFIIIAAVIVGIPRTYNPLTVSDRVQEPALENMQTEFEWWFLCVFNVSPQAIRHCYKVASFVFCSEAATSVLCYLSVSSSQIRLFAAVTVNCQTKMEQKKTSNSQKCHNMFYFVLVSSEVKS